MLALLARLIHIYNVWPNLIDFLDLFLDFNDLGFPAFYYAVNVSGLCEIFSGAASEVSLAEARSETPNAAKIFILINYFSRSTYSAASYLLSYGIEEETDLK